jgi:hypothetical protein
MRARCGANTLRIAVNPQSAAWQYVPQTDSCIESHLSFQLGVAAENVKC